MLRTTVMVPSLIVTAACGGASSPTATGKAAQAQLTALAAIVLQRLSSIT